MWDIGGFAADIGATSMVMTGAPGATGISTQNIAHEMGHCLGLYHTFHRTACDIYYKLNFVDNRADGENSAFCEFGGLTNPADPSSYCGNGWWAGDYVEDTWPDPSVGISYSVVDCIEQHPAWDVQCGPGTATQNSIGGCVFDWRPLANNIMDYDIAAGCTPAFTPGQGERMLKAIANDIDINKTVEKDAVAVNIESSSPFNICSDASPITLTAKTSSNYYLIWNNNSKSASIVVNPKVTSTYTATAYSECMVTQVTAVTFHVNDDVKLDITGATSICSGSTNIPYGVDDHGNSNYDPSVGVWAVMSGIASITSDGHLSVPASTSGIIRISYSTTSNVMGCNVVAEYEINVIPESTTVTITASQSSVCLGESVVLTASSTYTGLNYLWNGSLSGSSITVTPNTTTNYVLSVTNWPCPRRLLTGEKIITVNIPPVLDPISGLSPRICADQVVSLQCTPGLSGSSFWECSTLGNFSNALSPTTEFSTNVSGDVLVSYTLTDANNCASTVSQPAFVYYETLQITGPSSLCLGNNSVLQANNPGGTWASSNKLIANIDPVSGLVKALSPGTVDISYHWTGCGPEVIGVHTITVIAPPMIVQSKNLLCLGSTYSFTSNVTGSWISDDPAIATISSAGLVTPQASGSTTIKFLPTATTCQTGLLRVPITVVDCSVNIPCSTVVSTTISGGLRSTVFNPDNYIIASDLDISHGTVTFQNAQVIVNPGVTITVKSGATLEILGSHFYGCMGMWQGIVMEDGAKIRIDKLSTVSSLIEDAYIAVLFEPSNPVLNYSEQFISISNTIFNRNQVSIKLSNIADVAGTSTLQFPINIYNNIFTSRDIWFSPENINWENINTIRQTTVTLSTPFNSTPLSYTSPYIDNSIYIDNNIRSWLKDAGGKPDVAIIISNYGSKTLTGEFKSILIGHRATVEPLGEGNAGLVEQNTTIFDNHNVGVKVINANVIINNCTFQKPSDNGYISETQSGVGILVENAGFPRSFIVETPEFSAKNAFFDLNSGICVGGSENVSISRCDFRSSQTLSSIGPKGTNGIYGTNFYFDKVALNENDFANIRNAVRYLTGGGRGMIVKFGSLEVNRNQVTDVLPSLTGTISPFVEHAIHLQTLIYGENNQPVSILSNNIDKVTNGIILSGNGWSGCNVSHNRITLSQDVTGGYDLRYGIHIEGATGRAENPVVVGANFISGYDMSENTVGIQLSQVTRAIVTCDTVEKHMHGFRFVGTNPVTKFWDNKINSTNQYGMTLANDGVIDKQGNELNSAPGLAGQLCSSNNIWEGGLAEWNNPGQYMTFTDGSEASKSPLVIRNAFRFNPDGSGLSDQTYPGAKYSTADNTLIIATGTEGICKRCATAEAPPEPGMIKSLLEEIADGTVSLPNDDPEERLFVMRQQLYELLKSDPSQLVNSNCLQQFLYNNHWSNLDFIYYAGRYLADGDMFAVQTLLGSWPGQGNMDEAFQNYFQWMVDMYYTPGYTPDLNDVLQLANKCPLKYGTVVYAVRNLYNALTNEINQFDDQCDPQSRSATPQGTQFIRLNQPKKPQVQTEGISKAKVYPNPAGEVVNIEYSSIKQVAVTDITGRVVLTRSFNGEKTIQLNIQNLSKGLYLLKIYSGNQPAVTEKLIVE